MKKRLFTFLICIVLLLSSCSGDVLDPIITIAPDEFPTSELTEAPTAVSLAGYKVVRPEKAAQLIVSAAVDLKTKISAQAEGVTISDDWHKADENLPAEALEILVGVTNRPESTEMKKELLEDDFAVKYFPESRRIVILGGSDEATLKAISYFLEFCLKNGEIESTLSFLSAGQYAVTECILNGSSIAEYSLVIPDKADADEKYAAELIEYTIAENTGIKLETVKQSAASGKQILIGAAAQKTLAAYEYSYGTAGGNVILCGEGGLVVKASRALLDELFPKGKAEVSLTLGEAKVLKFERATYPALNDFGAKPIALADQLNASIAVYDLAAGDPVLKYEFKPQTAKGFSLKGYGNRVDEARLRYSEKWGTYIMLFTSSSGYCGVASYPAEECLWEAELGGTSPHSIEYLPNGMVAVASSGGSAAEKGFVRVYSIAKKNNNKYAEKLLNGSHAVLWDETRDILWAMGYTEIVAYEVGNDPAAPSLRKIKSYGCNDMKGGHDFSAICGNEDQVWVGGGFIRIFDKTTGKLIDNYTGVAKIDSGSVKCICSFPDGDAALTVATKVYADHNTDRFKLFKFEGNDVTVTTHVFDGRAFYKARSFLASYN